MRFDPIKIFLFIRNQAVNFLYDMVYFLWNCERIYLQRLDVNALPETAERKEYDEKAA